MSAFKKLLRLDSMTLRGVGSYFHGAELKFRPLTILCGTNGSGKSTWFNMLSILQRSLEKKTLPFSLDADDSGCNDHQLISSRFNSFGVLPVDTTSEEKKFGPYGTIGVHGTALSEGILSEHSVVKDSVPSDHTAARLLYLGAFEKGAKFQLRVAHFSDPGGVEKHVDFIELVLNDVYFIKMSRPWEGSINASCNAAKFTLECSRGFFAENGEGDDEAKAVIKFYPPIADGKPRDIENLSTELIKAPSEFLDACIQLIRDLYQHLLCGFFPISAVRYRQEITHVEQTTVDLHELIDELGKSVQDRKNKRTTEELRQIFRDEFNRSAFEELDHRDADKNENVVSAEIPVHPVNA